MLVPLLAALSKAAVSTRIGHFRFVVLANRKAACSFRIWSAALVSRIPGRRGRGSSFFFADPRRPAKLLENTVDEWPNVFNGPEKRGDDNGYRTDPSSSNVPSDVIVPATADKTVPVVAWLGTYQNDQWPGGDEDDLVSAYAAARVILNAAAAGTLDPHSRASTTGLSNLFAALGVA